MTTGIDGVHLRYKLFQMNNPTESLLSFAHKLMRLKRILRFNSKGVITMYYVAFWISPSVVESNIYQVGEKLNDYHFSLMGLIA